MKHNHGQITGLVSPLLESFRINVIKKYVAGGKILDYGCGTGNLAGSLVFDEYFGVDINPDVIDSAKLIHKKEKAVFFFLADEISRIETKFDYIILSAVIEHLDNPEQTLRKLTTLLNNHGKIVIITPTKRGNNILAIGSKFGIFSREAYNEHKCIFSESDLYNLALLLNLKISIYRTFELGLNQIIILSR